MQLISRRTHGFLDYIVGIILILAPRIFGFEGGTAAEVPIALGIAAIVYSLITRYELGVVKLIPFRVHLLLDVLNGLIMATSPWLFHFSDRVWRPHVALGTVELIAVLLTRAAVNMDSPTAARSA